MLVKGEVNLLHGMLTALNRSPQRPSEDALKVNEEMESHNDAIKNEDYPLNSI